MKFLPLLLMLLLAPVGAKAQNCVNQSVCATLPAGYLIAAGNQLQDGSGNNVRMACTYYPGNLGGSTAINADMQAIRNAGFNCIKRPWWDAMLSQASGVCCSSLADLDLEVTAAHTNHLKVVFSHIGNEVGVAGSLCRTVQQNGVWFDSGGTTNNTDGCGVTGTIPYATFKTNTVSLATRYSLDVTVIGFELHNQPLVRGVGLSANVNWGGGGASDVKAMCADVGAAVHAANAGALIICPGPANPGTLFGNQGATVPVVQARFQNPGQSFQDTFGNVWKITPSAQVSFNGTVDTSTAQVVKLALVGTTLQHVNGSGNWFSKPVVASPAIDGWAGPSSTSPLPNGLADRAWDFTGIFGANVHLESGAHNAAQVETVLDSMGIRRFRTTTGNENGTRDNAVQTIFRDRPTWKATFVQCDDAFCSPGSQLGNWARDIAHQITLTGIAPVLDFEGPNEPQGGCCGGGGWTAAQIQTGAQQLTAAIAANGTTNNVTPSLTYSSFLGPGVNESQLLAYASSVGGQGITWTNIHGYNPLQPVGNPAAPNGNGPLEVQNQTAILTPGQPFGITEWGYATPATSIGTSGCCTSTTRSGPLMANNYFADVYLYGGATAMFYEAFNDTGQGFSLVDPNTLALFPIGQGIHNFTTILADNGVGNATFTPGALNFTLSNIGSGVNTVRSLLLEKTTGKFELLLWNEPEVQNGSQPPGDVFPGGTTATVTLPVPTSVLRFDPAVGTTAQQTVCSNNCSGSFTVTLSGGMQILEITP